MPWFLRLAARFRPVEGWIILCLTWLAVMCLPAQAADAQWLTGMESGIWLATLALLLAWRLGHTRLHAAAAAAVLLLAGIFAGLLWGVHVLAPAQVIAETWRHLVWWLGGRLPPGQPWIAVPEQGAALAEFVRRIGWWFAGLVGGRGFPDNLVVSALALLLIWGAAAWAGWSIARRGKPFEALLPAAILLAMQAFVTGRGLAWLLGLLTLMPVLIAMERTSWLARRWEGEGLDYSTELHLTAAVAGMAVTIVVLAATPALPFLTSRQFADLFWRRFEAPYRQVEQQVNQSFPAAQGARSLVPRGGVAEGGLPRAHLLGGRPQLGQQVALRVAVRGAQPGDVLYWRGQTFSSYDGHGWDAGSDGRTPASLAAGQPWSEETLAERHPVLSFVDVYYATRSVLYGPAEPVSADRPYQAALQGPGNLIQLQIPDRPDSYTILSAVPNLNPNALRAAGTSYPPDVLQTYLQLPTDLPPEVTTYAAHVTAGAATPYDTAIAIEQALRRIPYSLDVPVPPSDRELVSWFLFDLKRGYCDYYATAMVVLARARGIPARLAIGYAPGQVEPDTGKYRVTELQAHSWPELYFPRLGWIPFEPTAAQPEPARVPGSIPAWMTAGGSAPPIPQADLSELQQRGQAYAEQQARAARWRWPLFAANVLLLVWLVWQLLPPRGNAARPGAAARYARLAAWGARLGRPVTATDTPREYAAALGQAALQAAVAPHIARQQRSAAQAAAVVQRAAPELAYDYEAAQWGAGAVGDGATGTLSVGPTGAGEDLDETRWDALWHALRRLWVARSLRI